MIRTFVGLPIPQPLVLPLTGAQAGLPAGRPVPPESLHLTLAFVGEHPSPVIEDLHFALDEIDGPRPALALDGLGVFGAPRPRTLYAAVVPDTALNGLRKRVAQAVRSVGIDLPRARFVPHVTLARFGRGLGPDEAMRLDLYLTQRMGLTAGPEPAPAFTLFRSRLGSEGAHYEALADYPLG